MRSPSALRGQAAPSSALALAALGRAVRIEAGYLPCGIKHVETEEGGGFSVRIGSVCSDGFSITLRSN